MWTGWRGGGGGGGGWGLGGGVHTYVARNKQWEEGWVCMYVLKGGGGGGLRTRIFFIEHGKNLIEHRKL